MTSFQDTHFSSVDRYALGVDTKSGCHYFAIPVSNGVLDYEELSAVTPPAYKLFIQNSFAAARFAQKCRRRERGDLLLQHPGTNCGTPF